MKRLLVTRPVAPDALERLSSRCEARVLTGEAPIPTEDELARAVAEADLLFTMPAHPVTERVIAAAPALRFIATLGAGYDNIDLAAAGARGIPVTHAPGILDETTADLAFALLLAAARRLPQAERALREGSYRGWAPGDFLGTDVHGATLGIVGLGQIGQAMARRARGFGMKLLYTGPHRKPDAEEALGIRFATLELLLAESDFVSLHAPLTPLTRNLIDAAALARMKPTAVLVNTARGALVDEPALARALRSGALAAAGLDVFVGEPRVSPELLALPNAVLTPHIGSASANTRRRMAMRAVDNILAFLDGRPLLDPVKTG
jgi:glyoxylate reductase